MNKKQSLLAQMFTASLFVIAKGGKQPKCLSTDKRLSKIWHTTKYYLAIKKEWVLIHATTSMNLENRMFSERGQS